MENKKFFDYLKKSKSGFLPVLLLAVGVILLSAGTLSSGGQTRKTEESRLEEVCSRVEGVGKCRVILCEENGKVCAVTVVCRGAEDVAVRRELTEMIASLYGIGTHRITVLPYG